MEIDTVVQEIDLVIESLGSPVTAKEASDGWTSKSKMAVHALMKSLKEKLQSGTELPPMSISKALDHWGVIDGEILERVAEISNQIRQLQRG